MKQLLKNTINIFNDYRYHSHHKQAANAILKNIESIKGKTNAKYIKQSNEYAVEVLGSIKYAPWLQVYSAMNSTFKEGWMPDNYYGKIVVPALKGHYGRISDLKSVSKMLFETDLFPDIAYLVNGLLFDKNQNVIRQNSFKDFLFRESEKVVFKLDASSRGGGVFIFTKNDFDLERVFKLGSGVFQSYIKQHPFFEKYMPSSVATIRLTTTIDEKGNSELRACFLRIGMKNETHVKFDTNVCVPVNIENGSLSETGYSIEDWSPMDAHPDTNVEFKDEKIPYFQDFKNTAISLHKKMPYAQCIGWDMVLDIEEEINIMEWNGIHNDIKLTEATQGPCFSDLDWENLWRR